MASLPKKYRNWRKNGSKRSSFNASKMAAELHDLLEIPLNSYKSSGGFWYNHPTKGRQIINAIVKVMVDALNREEAVRIPGFGSFVVEDRAPRKSGNNIVASSKDGDILGVSNIPLITPAKKVVVFYPSVHLKAMLNVEEPNVPNCKQHKAIESWSK